MIVFWIKTVSTIHAFILAMCTHPHVQHVAQAELDSVIGSQRLPSLSDRAQLPYIEAVVTELMRWLPVGPLGKLYDFILPDSRS